MIYCLYKDSTWDILSNIPLCFQEFPRALTWGTPSGEGVYLTLYPSSCLNTDTIHCTMYLTLTSFSLKLCSATIDLKHIALL